MIYLTGDTHRGHDMGKLSSLCLQENNISFKENDYLIITGDFGFPFYHKDAIAFEQSHGTKGLYSYWIEFFSKMPCKILFVDGNHDNHDWWGRQPVSKMFDGKVQIHPHSSNIIHLMRGEIYTIEGKSFFSFGGAASVDKIRRVEGIDWWRNEEPTYAETEYALDNLEKHDFKVDYILTHTMPSMLINSMPEFSHHSEPCVAAKFFNTVMEQVEYKKWFCGHFHMDRCVPSKRLYILYNTVTALDKFDDFRNLR